MDLTHHIYHTSEDIFLHKTIVEKLLINTFPLESKYVLVDSFICKLQSYDL